MLTATSYPYDIFTDEALLEPHRHYSALRELGPVVWLDAHQMYVLPRYAEAKAALADEATYCSGQGVGLNDVINTALAGKGTLMTDGDQHRRQRKLIGGGLTPRALRTLRHDVDHLAAKCVAELVERGSFDAVADLARALPLTVVPDLVGWPSDGREHLLDWASASFNLLGPLNRRAEEARPQVDAMLQFAIDTAAGSNMTPGSLGADLVEAARRGEVSPAEVPQLLVGYLAPSLDTTISAIGSAVWLLTQHPEQWSRLKADPALIPNAVNEVVRLESPVRAFSRVTTGDTTVGDVDIVAGSRVLIIYASANRDERHFANADNFDVGRSNAAEHLGFGYGVHGCAGQGLARIETGAVLAALTSQADEIELGDAIRGVNNIVASWSSLPITIKRRHHN